jgi:Flp pilus assembly protein TadD
VNWKQLWLPLAGLALVAGELAGAQQASPPANSLQPLSPAVSEAQELIHASKFAQAEAVLREQLRTQPRDADATYELAYCLLREDHPADALKVYTAAAALRKPSSAELVSVGQAYAVLGDDADADKWTLQALREDPKNAQAWYSLGRIRYTDQRFADAAACYKHVLELSPHNVKAQNNLGLAYEGQNRSAEAEAAYRQAIAWQDAEPAAEGGEQPLLNLAIILLHRGDTSQAEPLLVKAAQIAPKDPRIHEQLGHLYLQETRFDLAAKEFEQAIAEDPKNSGLHFLLGQAYKHLGRAQDAQAQFAAAAELAKPAANSQNH